MVIVVDVASPAIKLVGCYVRSHNFEVNGADIANSRLVLDKLKSLASPALATMRLPELEFVDKGVTAEILQAIPESQHNVTDRCFTVADKPSTAEPGLTQKRDKCQPCPAFVVDMAVVSVVLAHHRKHQLGIILCGKAKDGLHDRLCWSGHVLNGQGHAHSPAYA